jgi:hypothetical protein
MCLNCFVILRPSERTISDDRLHGMSHKKSSALFVMSFVKSIFALYMVIIHPHLRRNS